MAVDITKVITALNARSAGMNHWMAKCPCHNDDKDSLSISLKDNKILMQCMTGTCSTADILGASGLEWSDLSNDEYKSKTVFEKIENWARNAFGPGTFIKDKYPYIDIDGTYLYTKIRFEGCDSGKKEIRYFTINEADDSFAFSKAENRKKVLYRLPKLISAISDGFPVFIVEGEKDVHSLEKLGYTATTAGGTSDWNEEYGKLFKGADVRILPDNDEAGENLANKITRSLRNYAYKIKIVKTSNTPKGDVSDYLSEAGHNKETLKALINQSEYEYAPWIDISKTSESTNADKLSRVFDKQESYLITRDQNGKNGGIYLYRDGVYIPCGADVLKGEISKYYGYGKTTSNSVDNVFKMLMYRGNHFCHIDDLNKDEDIINLENGILRISTMTLEKHSPDYLSTCRLKLSYNPEQTIMPNFTKYIDDFCKDDSDNVDEQKKMVIQEVMGLILSNVHGYRPKKAVFLYSIIGNTGKTQLINLIMEMLGRERCISIQLQLMNSANRFALTSLPSSRLVCCGDQTGADVQESAVFKRLTGGDSVTVEKKGADPVDFHYKGFLMYACNALPNFKDDKGDQIFERLMIVPCCHTVPETERDRNLLEKMLNEKSAIFNWAMEGLQRLIRNNYTFTESEAIKNAVDDFRNRIDSVSRFLEVNGYVITGNQKDRVNARDLFNEYKEWCENPENEISYPITTSVKFADRMCGHAGVKKHKNGLYYFYGVKQMPIDADDLGEIPFDV